MKDFSLILVSAILAIVVFSVGIVVGMKYQFAATSGSYTSEHVANGKRFLYALERLEEGDAAQAQVALNNALKDKVVLLSLAETTFHTPRDAKETDNFLRQVYQYFKHNGGLEETIAIRQQGQVIEKAHPAMARLKQYETPKS